MAAAAEHGDEGPALLRTCHICGEAVESHVWYARTEGSEEGPHRVYTCPSCYFDLSEDERETYYRERV